MAGLEVMAVETGMKLEDGFAVRDVTGIYLVSRELADGVLLLTSPADARLYVNGMGTNPHDMLCVVEALQEWRKATRSQSDGNPHRLAAGKAAFEIEDVHVRAAILTLVEGWEAVAARLLDDDPKNGQLFEIAKEWTPLADEARCLIVTCPSTGARYAHLVPKGDATNAKAARLWIMHGIEPDIET